MSDTTLSKTSLPLSFTNQVYGLAISVDFPSPTAVSVYNRTIYGFESINNQGSIGILFVAAGY